MSGAGGRHRGHRAGLGMATDVFGFRFEGDELVATRGAYAEKTHMELDFPGKDSYELRKAGATQTVICTATRMAMISEFDDPQEEPELQQIVDSLDTGKVDLVLVEGYKDVEFPKIELHRAELGKPYLHPDDSSVIAIACDKHPATGSDMPVLDINNIEAIADFVCRDFLDSVR